MKTLAERVRAFLNAAGRTTENEMAADSPRSIGKRLVEVDPWAYERFMDELRLCLAHPEMTTKPDLVERFLGALPSAFVQRRCNCGERGCHTYMFTDESPYPGDSETLAFQTAPGWESFLIDYSPDGTILGVEIYIDD